MDPRAEPGSGAVRFGGGGIISLFVIVGIGLAAYGRSLIAGGGWDAELGRSLMMMGALLGVPALVAGVNHLRVLRRSRAEQELFASGRKAVAVVDGVRTTRLMVNDDRQIVLRLRVQPPGEPEFTYERRMFVPRHTLPRSGDVLDVAYDPADRSRVALATDWSSSTSGGQALLFRRPEAGETLAPGKGVVDELERLERLRQSGSLTFAEFEALKAKILSGQGG